MMTGGRGSGGAGRKSGEQGEQAPGIQWAPEPESEAHCFVIEWEPGEGVRKPVKKDEDEYNSENDFSVGIGQKKEISNVNSRQTRLEMGLQGTFDRIPNW